MDLEGSTEFIFDTKHWQIFLAEDQSYLVRCVIVLKRPCEDLADLEKEEMIDFLNVVQKLELAIKKAFGATMFNWSCLMNNAYRNNPPNPQVHWHLRPRYNHPVEFEGEKFIDNSFGNHYERGTNRIVNEQIRKKIVERILQNLS